MAFAAGTRLGPYEILAPIGAGGMGEVYRAKDTRLNRTVAIKVLPSHLNTDQDRRRLDREARTISSLNHPHICTLYDVGYEQQTGFLVMEYLEGKTLAELLKGGPLPAAQVLRYATEVADALDKAHKQGIIHRDLKPANIMITANGAKVLDFGIAKLESGGALQSEAETQSRIITTDGIVQGTLPYMAPEQLEGKAIDSRADIFSFGAVLYEMTSGHRPFASNQSAALIAEILTADPPALSSPLKKLVERCLAKDPEDRWQSMRDVTLELKSVQDTKPQDTSPFAERMAIAWIPWLIAAGLFAAVLFLLMRSHRENVSAPATPPKEIRFTIVPPNNGMFDGPIAISPDGSRIAFAATDASGGSSLWIRSLDSIDSKIVPDTSGASDPFWSPDSRVLGFFAEGKLKKVEVPGGSVTTICDVAEPRGGTWNSQGLILFSGNAGGGLYAVSDAGGNVSQAATLNEARGESSLRFPFFLPDGRHFLYYVLGNTSENSGISVGSLDSKEKKWLLAADSSGIYGPDGNILFLKNQSLMGAAFDAAQLKILGEPYRVAENVWFHGSAIAITAITAATKNIIAYRSGGVLESHLVWRNRAGNQVKPDGPDWMCHEPALSPDENKLSLSCIDPKTYLSHIWMMDLNRGTMTRLTESSSFEANSAWSPDGKHFYYSSYPEGGIYRQLLGTADRELVLKPNTFVITDGISQDGKNLVYTRLDFKTNRTHLWVLPLFGNRTPVQYMDSAFNEFGIQVSPNGRWVAYASDESGRFEVYVQSFPERGNKVQISTAGGSQPKWRGDNKEIFYISPDKKVMSVDIKENAELVPGVPKALFQTEIVPMTEARNQYAVTSDGQLFLVNTLLKSVAAAPIIVLTNWKASAPTH